MPTYEYECKECEYRFEAFQSMSDDPLKECPECGKEVRRLIGGGSGIIFKGSGFYVTDNKSASKSSTASSAGSSGSKSSNGADKGKKSAESSNSTSKEPVASKS